MQIPIAPSKENLASLSTEARNPASEHIDTLPTLDMLRVINAQDALVPAAVAAELPYIAAAVDAIAARFDCGGRLFYIGAGTSGRLGVLDASECPPTFAVPQSLFHALIAGGDSALRTSAEAAEDSADQGAADLTAAGFGNPANVCANIREGTPPSESLSGVPEPSILDTLIGIAASGRTPYVLGAIAHARSIGALTIGLSCVPGSPLAQAAEIAITPNTGPEILTGSTRLKAGTATKLVLNMLSTGVMIRTGAVFSNLMVNVQPTNAKLLDRAQRILIAASDSDYPLDQSAAVKLLTEAGSVKTAIVMHRLHLSRAAAEARLATAHGRLSTALQQ
jgi:N-acetylmuramic acid 6-phosphate etherase